MQHITTAIEPSLVSNDVPQVIVSVCVDALAADWHFFEAIVSGRWPQYSRHTIPFNEAQLQVFLDLTRGKRVEYYSVRDIVTYFGPLNTKWLLNVTLPSNADIELFRMVGSAEGSQHISTRLPVGPELFLDAPAVLGALSATDTGDYYPTVVRLCEEVGDTFLAACYRLLSADRREVASRDDVLLLMAFSSHGEIASATTVGSTTEPCTITIPQPRCSDKEVSESLLSHLCSQITSVLVYSLGTDEDQDVLTLRWLSGFKHSWLTPSFSYMTQELYPSERADKLLSQYWEKYSTPTRRDLIQGIDRFLANGGKLKIGQYVSYLALKLHEATPTNK